MQGGPETTTIGQLVGYHPQWAKLRQQKKIREYLKKEDRKEMALHPGVTDTSGISLYSSRVAQFGNTT